MGDFNVFQGGRLQSTGINSIGIQTLAGNHVKGSYVQVLAATAFDWQGFSLFITGDNAPPSGVGVQLTDIAIGAPGSELIIIPNLAGGAIISGVVINTGEPFNYIPLAIPAGTRIAARCQANQNQQRSYLHLMGYSRGFPGLPVVGRCSNFGAVLGSSQGTLLTTGASNVKGAWVQLVASTPHPVRYLMAMGSRIGANFAVDFAVGGVGSELIIIPDMLYNPHSSFVNIIPVNISQGTRVAARASCNGVASAQVAVELLAFG